MEIVDASQAATARSAESVTVIAENDDVVTSLIHDFFHIGFTGRASKQATWNAKSDAVRRTRVYRLSRHVSARAGTTGC